MSRYVLLLLLNLPFISLGIISAVASYKLKRSSKRRMLGLLIIWAVILTGLMLAQPFYDWLYAKGYTDTQSLSLFDVVQITAIVIVFYIANRLRAKVEVLERRLNDLHQEVSIRMSKHHE